MLCSLEPVKVAELVGGDDPDIDAQPRVGCELDSRRARFAGVFDQRQRCRGLCERERVRRGGDHVEVLDAVGHPSGRARQLHLLACRVGSERGHELLADGQGTIENDAYPLFAGAVLGERGEDRLLRLRAEPLQVFDPVLGRRLLEAFERIDPELVI
jgi:hypothetical protein